MGRVKTQTRLGWIDSSRGGSRFHHSGIGVSAWGDRVCTMVGTSLPDGGVEFAPWWERACTMVGSSLHHGGIESAPWWDRVCTMGGSRFHHWGDRAREVHECDVVTRPAGDERSADSGRWERWGASSFASRMAATREVTLKVVSFSSPTRASSRPRQLPCCSKLRGRPTRRIGECPRVAIPEADPAGVTAQEGRGRSDQHSRRSDSAIRDRCSRRVGVLELGQIRQGPALRLRSQNESRN